MCRLKFIYVLLLFLFFFFSLVHLSLKQVFMSFFFIFLLLYVPLFLCMLICSNQSEIFFWSEREKRSEVSSMMMICFQHQYKCKFEFSLRFHDTPFKMRNPKNIYLHVREPYCLFVLFIIISWVSHLTQLFFLMWNICTASIGFLLFNSFFSLLSSVFVAYFFLYVMMIFAWVFSTHSLKKNIKKFTEGLSNSSFSSSCPIRHDTRHIYTLLPFTSWNKKMKY
jgi:hypothetical protein